MVSIEKTGIMSASGEVNENLLIGSKDYVINRLESGNEYYALNVGQSYMGLPSGTTVTISFDLELMVNTANPQMIVYNTNNKGPKQFNNTALHWTAAVGEVIKERVSVTNTIVDRSNSNTDNNYLEFYTVYNTGNKYKITNLKMEIGTVPTPWVPNDLDDIYVGNINGFIETADLSRIAEEYVEGNEFIEY